MMGCAMKYLDGSVVRVGDQVQLKNGDHGVVVASMDTDEYSSDYPKEEWSQWRSGILVLTDKGALVRFDELEHQDLVCRA
jgi:hypothetical protein